MPWKCVHSDIFRFVLRLEFDSKLYPTTVHVNKKLASLEDYFERCGYLLQYIKTVIYREIVFTLTYPFNLQTLRCLREVASK